MLSAASSQSASAAFDDAAAVPVQYTPTGSPSPFFRPFLQIPTRRMFISFEGIDGSGKSTQARRLATALRAEGRTVVEVREPGGTRLAESVRALLLDPASEITPRAELLLFSAARADLVDRIIAPALERGDTVIADRFFDSTTAYQGAGRGVADPEWLRPFHRYVTAGVIPDRTYLLAISPAAAASRTEARGEADRMEASGEAFYERVAACYDMLAQRDSDRYRVVDATQDAEETHRGILLDAKRLLMRR